jgi:hypothetical protein
MNIVEPLRAILRWQALPEVWSLPLGPGRWSVLFGRGQRPLLVPAAARRVQKRALACFVPRGLKALHGAVLLRANAWLPPGALLPEFALAEGARGFLPPRLPFQPPAHTAVQIGTPGPYQKAAVLLMSESGAGIAIAKIAMVPGADHQVTREAGWLREFEGVPELEYQIPRLLGEGVTLTGRRYLVTSLAPGTRVTREFTRKHAAFLGALGRAGHDVMSFPASPCCDYLTRTLARIEIHLTRAERALLRAVLADCHAVLAGWTGPFVRAHGDFVPWNIRVDGERIFVFDWEYARAAANPLADAFNFFVLQRAVTGRGLGPRFMCATRRRVGHVARQLYPEWTWRPGVVSALGLAYLLEVLLHYSAANRALVRSHPVVAGYLRLMEARSSWMAL